jgi:tetratricopeptide (TPR) repeat protein
MGSHFDVFISSTKTDLEDFRKIANEAISMANMFPVDMKNFQPEAGNALQVCYDAVHTAELFIGIYAHKYGYCPDATVTYTRKDGTIGAGDGVTSITEWEYKWAIERKIPIMLFLINPDAAWKPSLIEKGAGAEGLEKFKAHIGKNHIVKFFDTIADFEKAIHPALSRGYRQLLDQELDRIASVTPTREQIAEVERRILAISNPPAPKVIGKVRFINPLPKIFGKDDFFDRVDHQAKATNLLRERRNMVSIYGKGGIGKTALACKVLNDFATTNHEACLAVFRMDDTPRPSADFILSALSRFLPPEHPALDTIHSPQVSIYNKTLALIDGMAGGQYIVYLDNFESAQHPTDHHIENTGIAELVTAILERGGGVLQLLITSRYPIPFEAQVKAQEKMVRVDDGLGDADAVAFMREMDGDNHALPPDDSALTDFIQRVAGYPRALEAIVGYLGQSVTHHIEDFTDNPALWHGEVMSNIVDKIHNTLPDSFHKVVGAIAIIGQKATQEEVEYALAPYLDVTAIPKILARLAEGRFVVYNRQTRTYGLHHYDLRYATESVPIGEYKDKFGDELPFTRYALYHRMAEFYESKRKPQEEWETIADLEPQLREITFRMALGDYYKTSNIMSEIVEDYLLEWGYSDIVIRLTESIEDKIDDPLFNMINTTSLGTAYRNIGKYQLAIKKYEIALNLAQKQENLRAEGKILGKMGAIYRYIGEVDKSIEYNNRALDISNKTKDDIEKSNNLGRIGNTYRVQGQIEQAIIYYEQALEVSRYTEDLRNQGIWLGKLGNAYRVLGLLDRAIEYTSQALEISIRFNDRRSEGIYLGNLGYIEILSESYQEGSLELKKAINLLKDIQAIDFIQYHLCYLTHGHWISGNLESALQYINDAKSYDVPANNHFVYVLQGCIFYCNNILSNKIIDILLEGINLATNLINLSKSNYDAYYSRGLGHAGLWIITQDEEYYTQSLLNYRMAVKICNAKGEKNENKQRLEALLACSDKDGAGLLALLG